VDDIKNNLVNEEKQGTQKPFVSLIIATKNEEKCIGKLLDSLVEQTYPKERFEILIFDGLSEDRTLEAIDKYKDKLNFGIYKNSKFFQVCAWNEGIDKTKANLFMIVNAHSTLSKDFIEKDINTFFSVREQEPHLAGVGGIYINTYENTFGKIVGLLYLSFFSGASSPRWKRKPHFSECVIFGVFDKKAVVENGKFDEDFIVGEDYELPLRMRQKGYKFFTDPEIKAYYSTRSYLRKFIRQTYNYAVGFGLMVKKGYFNFKWFVPTSFLIYEAFIFFYFAVFDFSSAFKLILIPFILYWLINIFVSFQLLIKTKDIFCLVLPLMYFIFHNVLGVGFLLGIILGKKSFYT